MKPLYFDGIPVNIASRTGGTFPFKMTKLQNSGNMEKYASIPVI